MSGGPEPARSREEDVAEAVRDLLAARERLRALTGGQGDAVVDPAGGGSILLQQAQEALVESRASYRRLVRHMPTLVFELAPDGATLFVNEAARVTGWTPDELVGRDWWQTLAPDQPALVADLRERLRQADVSGVEVPVRARDGSSLVLEVSLSNLFGVDGSLDRVIGYAIDVTQRVSAVARRLEVLLGGITEYGVFMLDAEGRVVSWNPGAERIERYTAPEILGKHYSVFFPEEDRAAGKPARVLAQAASTGRFEDEGWRVRKDGSRFLANVVMTALRDSHGRLQGFAKVTRDVTERRRLEEGRVRLVEETARREAAEANERRLRSFVEHTPVAVAMLDRDLRYLVASRRWVTEHRVGQASLIGRQHYEVFPETPARWKEVHRRALQGVSESCEEDRFERSDGRVEWIRWAVFPWLDATGEVGGIIIFSETITEQKLARDALADSEARLRQGQKMEAVGRLAGGVAHDFNNMLTAISGHVDLLLGELGPQHPHRRPIEQIQRAAQRATELTRQLLAFSRKQVLQPRVLEPNAALTETHALLQRLIGEDVELAYVKAKDVGRVRVDPCQLEQVLMNLVVNARDAMPSGGKITIETSDVQLDEPYCRAHPEVEPGRYVMIAVTDTGIGMEAATVARVFEPFFTTKPVGKGTGLGLATVYGMVKQSGGHISVYSEPGVGSTFKVYLPRVDAEVERGSGSARIARTLPGGTETILVVEDDELVRDLAREVLDGCGYRLIVTTSGSEALTAAAAHQGPIHLLLTDVVLPHLSGRQVADRLLAARPGLRVLFMSGYTEDAIVHHGVLDPGTAFLPKPFTSVALAHQVRTTLDQPGPG